MNFREKLEFLMDRDKITRAEMSRETGVAYTTIDSMLKRDEFEKLKLPVVQAIAKYFDVSLDYLMREEITDPSYGKNAIAHSIDLTEEPSADLLGGSEAMRELNFYEIGQRIKTKRKELNMTQPELAKKVGLSVASISKYENGKVEDATTAKFTEFASVLGVSPIYLMGWTGSPNSSSILISGVSKSTGEFYTKNETLSEMFEAISQLPDEAIAHLDNYIKFLVQEYKTKGE